MKFRFYGSMIVLSLLLNTFLILFLLNKTKLNIKEKICLLLFENFGFLFVGKILNFVMNGFTGSFLLIGYSSIGAVIGGVLGLLLFCYLFKKNIKFIFDKTLIGFPLMYAIGKIGCFISGCCYGIEYDGIGSVFYSQSIVAPHGVGLFPVQILESICFFIIFWYCIFRYKMKKRFNIEIMIILSGVVKFLLDFLRNSHIGKIISFNQLFCLIAILIGFLMFFRDRHII